MTPPSLACVAQAGVPMRVTCNDSPLTVIENEIPIPVATQPHTTGRLHASLRPQLRDAPV